MSRFREGNTHKELTGVKMLMLNDLHVQPECHASDSWPNPGHPVPVPEMASSNQHRAQTSCRVEPSTSIALLRSQSG
ncbi:hypothetical protein Q3G72_017922 [Acer saccharum]|nr:hypothetical protein Q3G72_017922 [Acer saccharum]